MMERPLAAAKVVVDFAKAAQRQSPRSGASEVAIRVALVVRPMYQQRRRDLSTVDRLPQFRGQAKEIDRTGGVDRPGHQNV